MKNNIARMTDTVQIVIILKHGSYVTQHCPIKHANDFMQGWYHARDVACGRYICDRDEDCLNKSVEYLANGTFSLNSLALDEDGNTVVISTLMVAVEEITGVYITAKRSPQDRIADAIDKQAREGDEWKDREADAEDDE